MRLSRHEAAARIAADAGADTCVIRIEEGDFGCEEQQGPPALWLMIQRADGTRETLELPESRVEALGLTEGGTCRYEALRA